MNKQKLFYFLGSILLIFFGILVAQQIQSTHSTSSLQETQLGVKKKKKTMEDRQRTAADRAQFEFDMVKDLKTGKIPQGIRQKELKLAKAAPKLEEQKSGAITITGRGPNNLGGRTRAIAFDSRDANIILSGGVSSGVFRSTDGGSNWTRVSSLSEIHNVTTIAQDPTAPDTWYYGTGEARGNSASLGSGFYRGLGIYKSTDNGITWLPLANTQFTLESFNSSFDFVHRIVVDPTNGDVYAAASDVIRRSTDGGATWSTVLGTFANNGSTDIVVTSTGRLYAAFQGSDSHEGVHTSTDGTTWTKIAGTISGVLTPGTWHAPSAYGRIVLAIAPSDETQLFALYDNGVTSDCGGTAVPEADLFRFDQTGGTWTDLSANLPDEPGCLDGNDPFAIQGGYDLAIAVKPDDVNTVFIGGVSAYRSTDGFTTTGNTTRIGGYASPANFAQYPNHHSDIHTFVFSPGDNDVIFTGSDGGVHKADITVGTPVWTSLNTDYVTYQYYHIDIMPASGSTVLIGGAQDNGTTESASGTSHNESFGGDGCAVGAISYTNSTSYNIIASTQRGSLLRLVANGGGGGANIRPTGTNKSIFVTYFHLDQDNTDLLYYADGDDLYRTRRASSITSQTVSGDPDTDWEIMGGVSVALNGADIRSMATSRNNAHSGSAYSASDANRRLYIGSDDGKVFRLNDPAHAAAATIPTDITPPAAGGGIVSGIAVNPEDDNEVMVTYSNYNQVGVFHTSNANAATPTWTAVEGGSGAVNLASIRSCAIAANGTNKHYFVGTSTGLYTTSTLNGTSTSWTSVGSTNIGLAVVSSMRFRPVDNILAIGTHGNGMFTADLTPLLPVELTSFEAEKEELTTRLTWTTASEQNNDFFEIQRSTDGENFEVIGKQQGKGTVTTTTNYEFIDRQPHTGKNYYRLRQVDFDGSWEHSDIRVVDMPKSITHIATSIFPNPFKENLTLKAGSSVLNNDVNISIIDMNGREYNLYNGVIRSYETPLSLQGLDLPKGIYFIRINGSANDQIIKVLKQ